MSDGVMLVGAPGAPTRFADDGYWSEETARMFEAVALCREELASRRPAPTTLDSILFALTELAEYAEAARLRVNADYIRNNERQFDARRELAQTGEMVLTALWRIDTEPRTQDAGAVMIGKIAYRLGIALVAWGKGQRHLGDDALARAFDDWRELASTVGEKPEQLIADELARIRAKFAPAPAGLFDGEGVQPAPPLRIEGTLPADDLRRAFVGGAAWWNYESTGFTMWNSERNEAEAEAELRYPNGKPAPNAGE